MQNIASPIGRLRACFHQTMQLPTAARSLFAPICSAVGYGLRRPFRSVHFCEGKGKRYDISPRMFYRFLRLLTLVDWLSGEDKDWPR